MLDLLHREEEPGDRGRWYGKYRAFVRDNRDPERLGRLRLEIPAVLGTGTDAWSAWASPCFPYGGNPDCGLYLLPEIGASVWAEFEGGDVQAPIWSGVWLAGANPGEMPAEAAANPTTCKVLKTAAGHTLLLEDAAGQQRVLIRDSAGQSVLLDAAGSRLEIIGVGELVIRDGSGSEIVFSGGAIQINAAGQVLIN
ncbi:MAG: phage baseplate assembly protein V [Armatimonadota bacterium]